MNKKSKILIIAGSSLTALTLGLGVFSQIQKVEPKSPKEWVMMAVEEEYQLDNNGRLLTHTAVIQTPSLEFAKEVEGETYGDYLYVKDDDGDYYMAFFRHYLVVEDYNDLEEYVYMSAIAWEKIGIHQWQILDLDIEELHYE